jgi:hypothetical protein
VNPEVWPRARERIAAALQTEADQAMTG